MPVSFSRLRIVGFKSFAEPATVEIMPGQTGIVGPNGCGKSNVVDALRWTMGENSARSLRGGEMEDVIFAGSAARASRNIAEVTLTLGEVEGRAPPPFHEQSELEISRKIERGGGSTYRVNGREVRARDVQTLFADLASGAQSSAIVSQGRVGALVSARPESRRAVLEEAAGITGLHARRHEAELKLRAAEANLVRAEDLRGQLETQLGALRRQARQASRYRNLSGHIRQAEAELFAIQRARAEAARVAASQALHDARQTVAAATETATAGAAIATEAAASLPPLRQAEAEARTTLERHRFGQEQVALEEARALAALAGSAERLAQIGRDLAHAEQLRRDAEAALARLAEEASSLDGADTERAASATRLEAASVAAAAAERDAEAAATRATEAAAEAGARAEASGQRMEEASQRARRLSEQQARLSEERDRIARQTVDAARLAASQRELAEAEAAAVCARAALETAEQTRLAAHAALAAAREAEAAALTVHARLAAEAQALAEVLAVKDDEKWPPMVDALAVSPGLEAALGAALGEELTSAGDREAPRHWRELSPLDPQPPLAVPALAASVEAPAALGRALSQIGLVETEADGDAGQPALSPGQMLVSRAGAVWRWDGYTIRAGTPTQAAVRLQQRNRLAALSERLSEAGALAEAAEAECVAALSVEREATEAEAAQRAVRSEAEARQERARVAAVELRAEAEATAARLAAAEEQIARLAPEAHEAAAALAAARVAHEALPDIAALKLALDQARTALTAARTRAVAALSARETAAREHEARLRRRAAIGSECQDWAMRAEDAKGRVSDLAARKVAGVAEHAELEAAPGAIALRRAAALDGLEAAEAAHRAAAEALQAAVAHAQGADRRARAAEALLAEAREAAVRAEGAALQAETAWGAIAERIRERLGVEAVLADPPAELGEAAEEKARKRHERLVREREEMGPVNLRADIEADEVDKQMAAIAIERQELETAIAKLRGSIGHLNREGRERLNTVFQDVDRNFRALFTRMFGGGRAHLAMVGSDDPLEAGLEIYA
ncbi:MAG: AAA family ATPase, partial [Alphaproteobacteria bacterium]|nr:AAA family ATPase [Alphaproteobacteria bacterium]